MTDNEKLGGMVWEGMFDQILERSSASPMNYAAIAITTHSEGNLKAAKTKLAVASPSTKLGLLVPIRFMP